MGSSRPPGWTSSHLNWDRPLHHLFPFFYPQQIEGSWYEALMLTMTNGDKYDAVHVFKGGMRAIINMDGAYVFVNYVGAEGYEPGEPARPGDELEMLNALVKAHEGTTVTTTAPDGTVTTFEDR